MSFQAIREQATDLSVEISPKPATQSATAKPNPRGASQLLADFHELQRQVDAIYAEQRQSGPPPAIRLNGYVEGFGHGAEQEWLRLIAIR